MMDEALLRVADDPAVSGLWTDVHDRWSQNGGCRGRVSIRAEEATAVRRLLGLRSLSGDTVALSRVADGLHGQDRLAAVLERAVGPLEDRPATRRAGRDLVARRRAERLSAWRAAVGSVPDWLEAEAVARPAGLPPLVPEFAQRVSAACGPGRAPAWLTFGEVGVTQDSAAHRLARRIVTAVHPSEDPDQRLALCRHPPEVVARHNGASDPVVEWCRRYGGRSPLKAVPPPKLDALIRLLVDLVQERFVAERPLLAVLARERFDDPHALDRGEPCGEVTVRFAAAYVGLPQPRAADTWRAAWASAGVEPDRVSSRVLVTGLLPTEALHPLSSLLAASAHRRDELSLGLRQLVDGLPPVACRRVLVVENPSVFESLMGEVGDDTALACCEGVPTAAARLLVRALVQAGVVVAVSSDDDRGGLTVKAVLATEGAQPLMPAARWEEATVSELRSWLVGAA